jgi:hypothetical protein
MQMPVLHAVGSNGLMIYIVSRGIHSQSIAAFVKHAKCVNEFKTRDQANRRQERTQIVSSPVEMPLQSHVL